MFLSASLILLAVNVVSARRSLSVETSGSSVVNGVDNFSVVTKVTNTGDETLKLFSNPKSLFSSFPGDSFKLKGSGGSTAEFVGARAKYEFEADTPSVTLAPGESKEVTHNLGNAYKFTANGDYEVEPSTAFYYADESGNPVAITADSAGNHHAKLEGSTLSSRALERRSLSVRHGKRAEWTGCSATQQTTITSALEGTTAYLKESLQYLTGYPSGTTRYTTWFGQYTSARYNTVLSHFNAIYTSDPNTYTYDCSLTGCGSGVYAYVYPDTFGVVHLCEAFWAAPVTGTDSKAGTIIHEASHFTNNGGTDDYAYGQANCKALAVANPDQAIMNADCHEYFAENTPAIP